MGKLVALLKLFPEHASEMYEFICTYDAVSDIKVICSNSGLIKYILGFAVFHDLTIYAERCPELKLDNAVKKFYQKELLYDDYDIRTKFGAYDGEKLLNTYDCPLRFVPTGSKKPVKYILADKMSDFEYWANQQERVLKSDKKRHTAHVVAMGNMLPVEKQIKQKHTHGNYGAHMESISDGAMHKIATKLAQRREIRNPNDVLLRMMYAFEYKNSK